MYLIIDLSIVLLEVQIGARYISESNNVVNDLKDSFWTDNSSVVTKNCPHCFSFQVWLCGSY